LRIKKAVFLFGKTAKIDVSLYPVCLPIGFDPNTAFMHQVDLLLNDLFTVLGVLHGFAVKVEVFRVNGLFVEYLVEFGA